ncbi:hypothetical protein GCM10007887_43320 [Methylobacterium haplocladii]|nr:hypothetical protein GCM10007887_43320 [Methylobacterium haplocladii]
MEEKGEVRVIEVDEDVSEVAVGTCDAIELKWLKYFRTPLEPVFGYDVPHMFLGIIIFFL